MSIPSLRFHVLLAPSSSRRWQLRLGRDLLMQLPDRRAAVRVALELARRSRLRQPAAQVVLHVATESV